MLYVYDCMFNPTVMLQINRLLYLCYHLHRAYDPVCYSVADTDYCRTQPCKNRGTCQKHGDSYICVCPSDYDGLNCESKW